MSKAEETKRDGGAVRTWLWIVLAMIWLMVIVGGITRLTGSGLSIVEWKPVAGVVPPLSDEDWRQLFAQYRESPQGVWVNSSITLAEFKQIFFWEYVHRLLGRLVGVVTFVPWAYFLARKRLRPRTASRGFLALVFGGSQGLLGWFMVASGLIDVPEVSHFRLAAHLCLAFFVGQWILWMILDLRRPESHRSSAPLRLHAAIVAFIGLLGLQIVYGAFMAGTRAGWLFSSFPDMGGAYLPGRFFTAGSLVSDLLDNPLAIHWIHRALAWIVLAGALGLSFALARRRPPERDRRRAAALLASAALLQFALGIVTVVLHMPIWAAVAHQAGAFVLLSCAVFALHEIRVRPSTG